MNNEVFFKWSDAAVRVAISVGTDRDTGAYVEYGTLFPSDPTEKSKSATQDTISGSSERIPVTISTTEATLVLRGYSTRTWIWDFTPSKAGTLYNSQTGAVVASLSAGQTYQHLEITDNKCMNYYFK